jgi:amino acid transporter
MNYESLVVCTGFISLFVIIFGFLAYRRYLRHKEIMALAEKGLVYPEQKLNNGTGKDSLRWGIVITAIGFALIVGLIPLALRGSWPLLLIGLLPAFFGLGLILIHVLTREETPKSEPDELLDADTEE